MIEFTTTFRTKQTHEPGHSGDLNRFCILLIGPFAGSSPTPFTDPVVFDLDSFESMMKKTSPSIHLDGHKMVFQRPLDFEPLMVAQALPGPLRWFRWLGEVRSHGLDCPAAEEVLSVLKSMRDSAQDQPAADGVSQSETETGQKSFEDLLTGAASISSEPTRMPSSSIVDKLISETVSGSVITPKDNADELLAEITRYLGGELRRIYHHPLFKFMETTWLTLDEMIGDFDTDDPVRFLIYPFNSDDWSEFIHDREDSSGRRSRLWETCPFRPDIIVTTETIPTGFEQEDLIHVFSELNKLFGSPVICNADFSDLLKESPVGLVTRDDLVDQSPYPPLAEMAQNPSIRLVAPRYRMRLPYGEEWNPAGSFIFEEFLEEDSPECLAWAPSSLLCARAWASRYREDEEGTNWNEVTRMAGFPPLNIAGRGEPIPASEYFLTENAMVHLYRMGCIPITSMRNSDHILVGA